MKSHATQSADPRSRIVASSRSRFGAAIVVIFAITATQPTLAAGAEPSPSPSATTPAVCAGGESIHEALFAADDGVHGTELWVTDGTSAGTRMVMDIHPDGSSDPQLVATLEDVVIFTAVDGVHRRELWRSDGTAQGTRMLADLAPGKASGFRRGAHDPVQLGERLLFWATDRPSGLSLWSTDGKGSTYEVAGAPHPTRLGLGPTVVSEGSLYVLAGEEDADGDVDWAVWRTDGTAGGTSRLPGPGPSIVYTDPISARDHVISARGYSVDRDPTTGWQVWHGEGLPQVGPVFIYDDLFEGPGLMPVTILDDRLLFYADAGEGFSLWASDGTRAGTRRIAPVGPPGSSGLYDMPEPLAILDDRAVLLAEDDDGPALWVSDGTPAGTRRLADLRWSDRDHMSWVVPAVAGGRVFLDARSGDRGRQVWTTDGTVKGTRRLTDLTPGSRPIDIAVAAGRVYIAVRTSERTSQLWTSDGTRSGTQLLEEFPANPAFWTTPVFLDGTEKGVLLVHPLRTVPTGRRGDPETAAFGLSTSDGSKKGTQRIRGVELHVDGQGPEEQAWQIGALTDFFAPFAIDGHVYFRNPDPVEPDRFAGLWRSDGTAAGTVRVSPIVPSTFLGAIPSAFDCAVGGSD
jgi:ELWxxDGT repeat protein